MPFTSSKVPEKKKVVEYKVDVSPSAICGKRNIDTLQALAIQLQHLIAHSGQVFTSLIQTASITSQRISSLHARVENASQYLPQVEEYIGNLPIDQLKQTPSASWKAKINLDSSLFTKETCSNSVIQTYDECKPPPDFSALDVFNEDGSQCLKKYTDPYFFIGEWIAEQKKEREKAKERRRKRREDKKSESIDVKKN